ncbi:hypothetical protein GCM10009754_52910 [Amycolatopsis minnesotensis]|uniref:Tetratricopeptide repeat protein n=1 Tax=Amycolatopsis minnesotensis TaxID=337894 RepID=A0ABP5D0Q0_9PSEU
MRVHALVQRATRDALPTQRLPAAARAAANALLHIWPEIERDAALGQLLRANTDTLAETAGTHLWKPGGHEVLVRAAGSLGNAGLVAEAKDYWHRLHTTAMQQLGPDHPHTLITRKNLAHWRRVQPPEGAPS